MNDEILQPNQPAQFEARNMRPRFRRLKSGDIFLIEIECEEAVWNTLRAVPENALLDVILVHHDGDSPQIAPVAEKPKKERAAKSRLPYAMFWSRLHAKGFDTYPDWKEVLQCEAKDVHQKLREFFETDHLSAAVGPHEFRQFVKDHQMSEGLITLANQAEVWAMEKAGEIERV